MRHFEDICGNVQRLEGGGEMVVLATLREYFEAFSICLARTIFMHVTIYFHLSKGFFLFS